MKNNIKKIYYPLILLLAVHYKTAAFNQTVNQRNQAKKIQEAATANLKAAATANRDNCKQMGDACVCGNTNLPGYCLPGWESNTQDQLYCDCTSDVLSEEEVISVMIERYCASPSKAQGFNPVMIHEVIKRSYPKAFKVFEEIYKIVGKDPINLTRPEIATQRDTIAQLMRQSTIANVFFAVSDGCSYVGKPCKCSSTGRGGLCSMSRVYRFGELRCHCE